MAKKPTLELMRGSAATRLFKLPISLYQAGAILGFAVKPVPDNDLTDAAAVIKKTFTDANVDLDSDPTKAIYTLSFTSADTVGITFDEGVTENTYVGQFKYKKLTVDPEYYPGTNKYIQVIIYADIRRETP